MEKRKKLLIAGAVALLCAAVLFLLTVHFWTEPTCTEAARCKLCGKKGDAALGHDWTAADCLTAKTCDTCGETEAEPLGHDWSEATCDAPRTCVRCGEEQGEKLEHQRQEATCEEPQTCSLCSKKWGEPLGHSWVAADCLEPKHCIRCDAAEGEALGHDWKEASCSSPKKCRRCKEEEGEKLEHEWVEPTCCNARYCRNCSSMEGDPLEHEWAPAVWGKLRVCVNCGGPHGHEWQAYDDDGVLHCRLCGSEFRVPDEDTVYPMIFFENHREDGEEYGIIWAIGEDNKILWKRETQKFPTGRQYFPVSGGAQSETCYYYQESGVLFALDIKTGRLLWKDEGSDLTSFVGVGLEDGRVVLSCYDGPELYVIDGDGNVLHRVDYMFTEAFWPIDMWLEDGKIHILMRSANSDYYETHEGPPTVVVDPDDYSYTLK